MKFKLCVEQCIVAFDMLKTALAEPMSTASWRSWGFGGYKPCIVKQNQGTRTRYKCGPSVASSAKHNC